MSSCRRVFGCVVGARSSVWCGTTTKFTPLLARQELNLVCTANRFISSTSRRHEDEKKRKWPFHITMSDEQKKEKAGKIKEMKEEEPPKTLFAKVKYYFKRYWYIAVPAHAVSCTSWFGIFYAMVHSGVDVIALLEWLHLPDLIIAKVRDTPPSAGEVIVALLLYKVAMPIRYATTMVLIQATFWTLRRLGRLQTAREVEYKVRSQYEHFYGRKLYRYRHLGVRSVGRRNSAHSNAVQQYNNAKEAAKRK